jgi:hypothetical protein
MTTIDKGRYIEPSGTATFEQDAWSEEIVTDQDIENAKARIAKYTLFIVAGIISLSICAVQFWMDVLEKLCPVCFGR